MAVTELLCAGSYIADGEMTLRDIGFQLLAPRHLIVRVDDALQTLGADYQIAGDFAAGLGVLQPLVAWPVGATVSYSRSTPAIQEAEIPAGQPLPSRKIEQELDRRALVEQELGNEVGRAMKVPAGELLTPLPSIADRAGKLLAFTGMGVPIALPPAFDGTPVNDYGPWDPEALFSGVSGAPDLMQPEPLDMRKAGFIDSATMDQSATMEALAAYVNATSFGCVINWPAMRINVSRDILFTKPVRFSGALPSCSKLLCQDSAQMKFYGLRTPYASTMFSLENLWIATQGIHASFPIHVEYQDGYLLPDASLAPTLMMRDMFISGRDRASGFLGAVDLLNVPWPKISNVSILGDQQGSTRRSAYGIRYRGKHGSMRAEGLRCYFVETGLDIEGEMEGIVLDGHSEMVAVRNGVRFADSSGGLQPYFVMSSVHINAEACCVKLEGIDQFAVGQGCSFYGQNFDGTDMLWVAVDIYSSTSGESIVQAGTIADLMINGDGQTAGKQRYGVRINGGAGFEDYLIDNVRFQGLDIGVQLGADVNGVQVTDANSARNVVVPIQNLGTGKNFIQGLSYRYPFARLPDAASFAGARLFVIDSGVTVFGAPAAGGGSGQVPVYSDGAVWRVG